MKIYKNTFIMNMIEITLSHLYTSILLYISSKKKHASIGNKTCINFKEQIISVIFTLSKKKRKKLCRDDIISL